ncbi:uncharacterized protein LOC128551014 [Mercenaria mercenaria]|uniref:uncharacterized protein LOC128551014 n=1 Tax=Mercenaria mercenaria TaxID=6596 RepID=UPI00234F3048|nr:uncharacterized protein LOC128551014 [Mercenaria mercenaria]
MNTLTIDSAIEKGLEVLQYEVLRPNQRSVIKAYLEGNDVLYCAPTGSGKNDIRNGKADIIFASPESILGQRRTLVTELSKTDTLKAIFIDEAHCIKKFGTAKKKETPVYRPAYSQLGELRSLVQKHVPVIALTATADEATRNLIIKSLCMSNPQQILITPEKKNVKYSVETGSKDTCSNFKWLRDLLDKYGENCPRIIVFFRQIKHISEVFEYLQTSLGEKQYSKDENNSMNGYWNRTFAMFHLTTNEKIKKTICSSFQHIDGKIRVVLCSTSFSMGLDVKQVHTVVHFGPANDLDDYLQESGRAGRDPDRKYNAVLIKHRYCLSSQNISVEMKNFIKATTCRRVYLLKNFAEKTSPLLPKHDCCDNCAATCTCTCDCKGLCSCISTPSCSSTDSEILLSIRSSVVASIESSSSSSSSSSSEDENFSSGSEIEQYLSRKPNIVYDSDSD